MAVERGEGVGRCILVGLHMDAVGRDLLRWALNQAARPGDRVVAVHIYRKSGWYLPRTPSPWQLVSVSILAKRLGTIRALYFPDIFLGCGCRPVQDEHSEADQDAGRLPGGVRVPLQQERGKASGMGWTSSGDHCYGVVCHAAPDSTHMLPSIGVCVRSFWSAG
jgi:hypothetical protein